MKKVLIIGLILAILIVSSVIYIFASDRHVSNSTAVNSSKSNVTLFFSGDVMLGRGVGNVLSGGQNVFHYVDPLILNSDGVVVNLEGPFTTSSENIKGSIPLKSNPFYVKALKENNVIVACLANNHIMDYGETGMEDTINTLENNGINYIGAGENLNQSTKPVTLNIKGRKITVLNFMDNTTFTEFGSSDMPAATANSSGYAPADWNIVKDRIDESKNTSDFTVVVFHYGNEYSSKSNSYQKNLSHKCIDEGADMVIGSHPHVVEEVESYKGKPIFYSLGNFVFDQSNPATHTALLVELDLIDNNARIVIHPITIIKSSPRTMDISTGTSMLERLKSESSLNMNIDNGTGILIFPLK